MNQAPDVIFPKLGIEIGQLNPVAFSIFGIGVYWYGIIIGCGVILGLLLAMHRAKKTGQDPEIYQDLIIYTLVAAIIGARIYYVVFSWDNYKDNLLKIFAFREGGLGIYGGIVAAVIVGYFFTKKKKLSFGKLADTTAPSIILGQAIGRWGNFVNKEAFGGYTDNIFAMCIKKTYTYQLPEQILDNIKIINNVEYIQVHPTFFYEFVWNSFVFIILLLYRNKKKFEGQIFLMYIMGYSLGRVWIEGLRADQLLIPLTTIPVSQLLSVVLIIISFLLIIYFRKKQFKEES